MLAGGGELVVLAGRTVAGFLPGSGDEAIALEAAEEGVEGALWRGERLAEGGELGGELVAVVGFVGDEGEDAELENAAAGLGEEVAGVGGVRHGNSVAHSTLRCTVVTTKGVYPWPAG
jgi:hypothetical protein